ncbi:tubulin-folding cofactor B-like [Haliaeetus albicilla]|uniref:tubulin-folding cofactor B-like n=1 Tax=Haliaeetus albicilla TaxID=8969 RepID=UPI0037E7972C
MVGSPASCMDLELYGAEEELLGRLDCDEALLGSYPVADGCRVHVIDQSGAHMGEYEDVLQVKYEIAESDYKKRPESLRPFPHQQRWGHYDTEGTRRWAQEATLAAALPLGARCQVRLLGQPSKLATIMFVGQTHFKLGYWVGVCYDEPLGKHDGRAAASAAPPPSSPPAGRPRLINWRFKVSSPGSVMGSWPPASASSPVSRATPAMMLPTVGMAFSSWGACVFPTGWAPTW